MVVCWSRYAGRRLQTAVSMAITLVGASAMVVWVISIEDRRGGDDGDDDDD